MDDKKITAEELLAAMQEDFSRLAEEVAEAMNTARAGRIIADSEEPVRDANAEFRERLYQTAADLLAAKREAFSPSGDGVASVEEQGQAGEQPSDGERSD